MSVKDKAQLEINKETNLDGVGQLKENTIQQIKNMQNKAEEEIQTAIQEFIALQQNAINEVEQVAATAKEEINGLGVDEDTKKEGKEQIDIIVSTAKTAITEATNKNKIYEANVQAISEIYNVVQNLKDMWITARENMTVGTYGTLCWNYNLTDIDGAELYAVAGMENDRIILEEVLANEAQAGAGYVILATADTLRVKNGDQYTDTPLSAAECNGLQGTFELITDEAAGTAGNKLEDNYIIYNNEWSLCGGDTELQANRAYLVMDMITDDIKTPDPSRKYVSMPLSDETQTKLNNVVADADACTDIEKYFYKGHVIIRKGNKSFNIQGIEIITDE